MRGKSKRRLGPVFWSVMAVLIIAWPVAYMNDLNVTIRIERGAPAQRAISALGTDVQRGHAVTIRRDATGFHVDAEVGGTQDNFLIDTGATHVFLTEAYAARIGFNPDNITTCSKVLDALNNQFCSKRVLIKEMRIGTIVMHDVVGMVGKHFTKNLLGLSFLDRLNTFSYDGRMRTLVLAQ